VISVNVIKYIYFFRALGFMLRDVLMLTENLALCVTKCQDAGGKYDSAAIDHRVSVQD
jgi:hypothetical protein